MRTSTILLTVAAIFLTVAAAAIGFFAGRASVPDDHAPVISERTEAATTAFPRYAIPVADEATPADLRARLLDALDRPAAERNRAIRVAMNAWLAVDGAAAIMAVRDDLELGEVANRMTHFALFAYPELFVDDRSLLESIPDATQSIAMAARAMAMFDPDAARAMVDTRLSDSMFGVAVLSAVDQIERAEQDPYAELESIVAERDRSNQIRRLFELVIRVAAEDPVAAAELIDDLPAPLMEYAIKALAQVWSRADPEQAARWFAQKGGQASGEGLSLLANGWRQRDFEAASGFAELWGEALSRLANGWGQRDFEAANAFADTLTGRRRAVFLTGLVNATGRLSNDERLAWVSRYENDPAYPNLILSIAKRFAQEDIGAAIELIEMLPEEARLISHGTTLPPPLEDLQRRGRHGSAVIQRAEGSYRSVLPSLAFQDPEAAIGLIDEMGNESVRNQLLSMVAGVWGLKDAESALDWALGLSPGPTRDQAIASISPSLMEFDMDRAVDAINEIEDPELRKIPVWQLLRTVESDDEAIRLGVDYGFDRDAVLEVRENRSGMHGPTSFTISRSFGFSKLEDRDADRE